MTVLFQGTRESSARCDTDGFSGESAMNTQSKAGSGTLSVAYLEALLDVSRIIAAYRDPKDLFPALAKTLSQVIDLSFTGVVLYDEKIHARRLYALESFGQPMVLPSEPAQLEETAMWYVYQHQQPVIIPFVDRETRFPHMIKFLRERGIGSHCTLPLTTAHRRLGTFSVNSELTNAYPREAIRFLSLVASQVALAIGDALNLEVSRAAQLQSQQMYDRLKLILDVNNNVASNLQLRDLLRAISGSIRQVMGCDSVIVAMPDPDGRHLRISAVDFPENKGFVREENRIPIAGSYFGRVFQTREPYLTGHSEELTDDPAANPNGFRTGCIVPLICRDRVLGVLGLARFGDNGFTPQDLDFLGQVSTQIAIAVENALAYGQITELKERLAQEKLYLEDEIRTELNFKQIVGRSAAIRRVLHEVETVAGSDSTVLILGETGTGKELVARAIHDISGRRSNAFVKLNCAAIPTGLLESELFGHEKGAFTGAISQHIGRFELAHHGTVFLDEIGDIPLELQPKLLRVLQDREYERLGSTRTLQTDARLIAATNRDLDSMVDEQTFRADLFYRLNVFPIHMPALRERQQDIPLLVRHFAEQFARRMNKRIETIPSETMNALIRYHWPGNIRELQNVIERAVIVSTGPVLKVPAASLRGRARKGQQTSGIPKQSPMRSLLEEAEREQIIKVLQKTDWVVAGPNGAATRLGMKRSTLQFRMQKLGISRRRAEP